MLNDSEKVVDDSVIRLAAVTAPKPSGILVLAVDNSSSVSCLVSSTVLYCSSWKVPISMGISLTTSSCSTLNACVLSGSSSNASQLTFRRRTSAKVGHSLLGDQTDIID